MNNENVFKFLNIDEQSITPKYLQIVNAVLEAVQSGKLSKGYFMPSINNLSYELDISRDTAERAFRQLKSTGVIDSIPGKGYFVAKTDLEQHRKVLLLFNKLSAHKKIMYDAFAAKLGEKAAIDFYIYNNDFLLFKDLLQKRNKIYSHYVIIPHFLEGGENANQTINEIKGGHLILMDKLLSGINREYGAVYEDFEWDIFTALKEALPQLSKYHTLKMIFPEYTYHAVEILKGFYAFCDEYAFAYKVVKNLPTEPIGHGEVYINLMEDDLVVLLEKINETELQVGDDVGVISYNETPWKKFILKGITTVSTNFRKMGEMTADLVLKNSNERLKVPFSLTLRNSL